jgi:nucleotide-binding universal stress UspA family protein
MKTIIALVDFSDVALNVLKQAQTLAQAFKSQVTVLHGIPMKAAIADAGTLSPVVPHDLKMTEEEIQADMARLEKLTEPLRTCGLEVSLKQFHDATIDHVVEEALRPGPDLIVVGSHQHNAFYNLLVGSVTDLVLKRAKCPVLVVAPECATTEGT